MFSCTCGSPDTALSIVDVGTMSVELRHDLGSSRSLRSGALLESTQVMLLSGRVNRLYSVLWSLDGDLVKLYVCLESVFKRQTYVIM